MNVQNLYRNAPQSFEVVLQKKLLVFFKYILQKQKYCGDVMDCYGLIADIGGTNARFAIADDTGYYEERILRCKDYSGPAEMAKAYLDQVGQSGIRRGGFAIAGPVDGDIFFAVNLPWSFSIKNLGRELGFEDFRICNDFTAVALSIPRLKSNDVRQHGGIIKEDAGQQIAVLGPGTGLGAACLVFRDGRHYVVSGEGGHATVPMRTRREFEVMELLNSRFSHVSAERVCSGQGLENIYNSLRLIDGSGLPERQAAEISAAGINNSCALCRESLDMMMAILGRVAGNLVMTAGAWRGVYIAGGIVVRLGEYFYTSPFRKEFEDKGRFKETMEGVPAFVILHPQPALVGLQSSLICDNLR